MCLPSEDPKVVLGVEASMVASRGVSIANVSLFGMQIGRAHV